MQSKIKITMHLAKTSFKALTTKSQTMIKQLSCIKSGGWSEESSFGSLDPMLEKFGGSVTSRGGTVVMLGGYRLWW